MRRVVRAAPRISRITSAVIPIAAAYRLHRVKTAHLEDAEAKQRLEALHAESAERLYHLFVEMRGGVLKIGQFLSCRVDLLPPIWIQWLSKLQDQVPAVPTEEIKACIEAELGRSPEALFDSFDEEPLAAASLAQVHAAVLHDGTPVVVKVQVPGVAEVVDADLRAVRILAHALRDLLPPGDTETILGELEASVRRELSYTAEAQNLQDFAAHFADDPDVVVPCVYEELSGQKVLTMERVQGGRLMDYLDAASPADRDRVFEILLTCVSAQVLEHGLLHADPHPGNFLVCEGPRLAVLDFGSVQRYSKAERAAYAGLAMAILNGDSEALAQRFRRWAFLPKAVNSARCRSSPR
jgi:ubiquinone biosynthesis protein